MFSWLWKEPRPHTGTIINISFFVSPHELLLLSTPWKCHPPNTVNGLILAKSFPGYELGLWTDAGSVSFMVKEGIPICNRPESGFYTWRQAIKAPQTIRWWGVLGHVRFEGLKLFISIKEVNGFRWAVNVFHMLDPEIHLYTAMWWSPWNQRRGQTNFCMLSYFSNLLIQ